MTSSAPQSTTIGSAPMCLATMAASFVSSSFGALMRMVKHGIGEPRTLLAIATTMLESTPPERYDTTGTSARSRRSTEASSSRSNSSTSVSTRPAIFLAPIRKVRLPVGMFGDRSGCQVNAQEVPRR